MNLDKYPKLKMMQVLNGLTKEAPPQLDKASFIQGAIAFAYKYGLIIEADDANALIQYYSDKCFQNKLVGEMKKD